MICTFADPKEWSLKITPEIRSQLWLQSQRYRTPSSRWRAYINQICLYAFLNWVETEYSLQGSPWYSSNSVPAFWEFVNGTAVLLNHRRIILVPSEAIDDSELEVAQEWVDIPSWSGDFYLAVQVKPDCEWVRFWGYTTHQELKALAQYDSIDRTYCVDEINLTKDLNAFWMAYQFCKGEEMKTDLSPLPALSATQAKSMQERLGNSSVTFPRLELPFSSWGALLENEKWRQELYQQRQQDNQIESSQTKEKIINLSAWLQGIYEDSWQAIETLLNLNNNTLAFNFRSSTSSITTNIKRAKVIDFSSSIKSQGIESQKVESQEVESQKFIVLVALTPGANQHTGIRVQLHPIDEKYLPNNIKLILLSESGEIIQEVQAKVEDNYIQLKLFEGEVGEFFNIKVVLNTYEVMESFVI